MTQTGLWEIGEGLEKVVGGILLLAFYLGGIQPSDTGVFLGVQYKKVNETQFSFTPFTVRAQLKAQGRSLLPCPLVDVAFPNSPLAPISPPQPKLGGGGISAASAMVVEGFRIKHLLVFIVTLFLSISSFHLIALQEFFLSLNIFICSLRSCWLLAEFDLSSYSDFQRKRIGIYSFFLPPFLPALGPHLWIWARCLIFNVLSQELINNQTLFMLLNQLLLLKVAVGAGLARAAHPRGWVTALWITAADGSLQQQLEV